MEWDPTEYFRTDTTPKLPYAILVLNQPINERAFDAIRKHACFILCADGGANRYYDLMQGRRKVDSDLPSAILGDLDSLRPDVREHYAGHGVPILHDADQYSTDFTKCLRYLDGHAAQIATRQTPRLTDQDNLYVSPSSTTIPAGREARHRLDVLILGGLGGRVDQAFSQIHHLYSMTQQTENTHGPPSDAKNNNKLFLVSEESISFVLPSGDNTIHTPSADRPRPGRQSSAGLDDDDDAEAFILAENVGLIPLVGASEITLRGFEWDVTEWPTEIGGQLSTSNHIRADVVEVATTRPVLFTVELAGRLKKR